MRGLIPTATTPMPIAAALPAMYEDDDFAQRLTAALDEVAAPLHTSLDSLEAYLDPRLAPPDFLLWVGSWVGCSDELRGAQQPRDHVVGASARQAARGTVDGLVAEVAAAAGVDPGRVQVSDGSGVVWSTRTGTSARAAGSVRIVVHAVVADPERLRDVVAAAVPLHLDVQLELPENPEEQT